MRKLYRCSEDTESEDAHRNLDCGRTRGCKNLKLCKVKQEERAAIRYGDS